MRRISRIDWIALAAATAVAFAATPSSAEDGNRGFHLRLGVGSAAAATPAPIRAAERLATAGTPFPIAPAAAAPRPEPIAALKPVSAAPAPQPVRVAGPWCPPERIVGVGAGFCAVN